MRIHDKEQLSVLKGSFNHHYEADIFYGGERRLAGVPITSPEHKEDGAAAIQQSGSFTIVWMDDFGKSISPRQIGDTLSPFGPEVHLYSVLTVGKRASARVKLGQFPITNVPSAVDQEMEFRSELITVGSVVELEFKELTTKIDRDRFDVPTAPTVLKSVWDEVARITGAQITRSVPDAAISRAVMYQENRLDAVADLLDILDAVPHVTADGTLGARPNAWPDPVDSLQDGDGGSLVSVGHAMNADETYNRIAFRGKSGQQQMILASAEITSGPLRTKEPDGTPSPFGRVTRFVSSDYITTTQQAQDYVNRELERTAGLGVVVVPVVETFNPLRERGDVIELRERRGARLGRIRSINRDDSMKQSMNVEVING
ncbi:hypothetical protein P5G50_18295 [Leifsonia sp. F6_8S_P_1B]|uniref:Uncharacterized protein n=1 Tax=Leifsonia williamsii TaxID=3035919 RepID=A0ABT8KHC2_9MICO|nr:hypothetical protein [Leifsonia williamsii]MDN4616402.1 hypothetical protein [Leifsonia williamsii]